MPGHTCGKRKIENEEQPLLRSTLRLEGGT